MPILKNQMELADQLRSGEYLIRLPFPLPFDWRRMLAFLSLRATAGVELVQPTRYRRTFSIGGQTGTIDAWLEGSGEALTGRIGFRDSRHLPQIVERIGFLFDLEADSAEIGRHLGGDAFSRSLFGCTEG